MSEDLHEETGGLSRRSMIKRGALVGGTLVWAQPVVQGFGTAAGAQSEEGTPLGGFSYAAATFTCNGTTFAVKFELDGDGPTGSFVDPGNNSSSQHHGLPGCHDVGEEPPNWHTATPLSGSDAEAHLTVSGVAGQSLTFTLTDPDGCSFLGGDAGAVKHGQDCGVGTVSGDGNSITFNLAALDPNPN